jgi:hypothetical protein
MRYLIPKLKNFIVTLVHPRSLVLRHQGLTDEDLLQDHNTWFV